MVRKYWIFDDCVIYLKVRLLWMYVQNLYVSSVPWLNLYIYLGVLPQNSKKYKCDTGNWYYVYIKWEFLEASDFGHAVGNTLNSNCRIYLFCYLLQYCILKNLQKNHKTAENVHMH